MRFIMVCHREYSGIDIGKYKGAPIYTTANRGKVVLRDNFYHGKTDYRSWVADFSVYTHLDAFDVRLLEVVGRGQKIGKWAIPARNRSIYIGELQSIMFE